MGTALAQIFAPANLDGVEMIAINAIKDIFPRMHQPALLVPTAIMDLALMDPLELGCVVVRLGSKESIAMRVRMGFFFFFLVSNIFQNERTKDTKSNKIKNL